MAVEKAAGVVIRLIDYSETSQIATFLTDRFGRISAIAKGAKRPKSGTGGALDMLTVNEIVFSPSPSGGLATLREARTTEQFQVARLSLAHYYAALYLAELSDIFGVGTEGSPDLFNLLVEVLRALSAADVTAIANLVFYFETHALAASGLAANLTQCIHCGVTPPTGQGVRISAGDGGIVCAKCGGGVAIPPATLAALKAAFRSTLQGISRLRLHGQPAAQMASVLSAMIVCGAHRVPRLLKYVRPGYGNSWKKWAGGLPQ